MEDVAMPGFRAACCDRTQTGRLTNYRRRLLQLWRPDSKIKAPPGASRAKLPALWGEAGVTRPQHTAQNRIRTQIQYLNMDSVSKRKNLMSPRLIHPEVTWKGHSVIYSPKIDFRLPRLHESKLGRLVPSCPGSCGQRSSQGSWFETLKPCTQG